MVGLGPWYSEVYRVEELAAGEVRWFLCQVLPATFIALRVKICRGDDIYHVPQPSTFHKTLAT